mgnify:FL=1
MRAALEKINRILALKEEQARMLNELAQSLVSRVSELVWWKQNYTVRDRRCARCGRVLGREGSEYIFEFDGMFWHNGNCT